MSNTNFVTVLKNTDRKLWIGMVTVCVGWTLSLLGAHQDGVNDVVRAAKQLQDENATDNEKEN